MFLWLFLFFHPPTPIVQSWWVVAHAEGAIERLSIAPEQSSLTARPPLAIWYGAPGAAPRRLSPAEAVAPPKHVDAGRLRVEVLGWTEELAKAGVELIAAPLAMWREAPEELLPRFAMGRTGRTSLPWRPGEAWRLRLVGEGVGSWWFDLAPGQTLAKMALSPCRGVPVEIVGPEGNPVGQAEVSVTQRGADAADGARLLARFRTATGSLELPSLPDGYTMTLTAGGLGWLPQGFTGYAPDVPRRWVLERGASLTGQFVNPEGEGVAEVRVIVEGWIQGVALPLRRKVQTDENGRWNVENLPVGPLSLAAGKPGFAPLIRQLTLPPTGLDLGAIALVTGLELSVQVRTAEGEPIAGASVALRAVRPRITDAQGWATLPGLAAGRPNELFVEAPGYLARKVWVRPPVPERLEVELSAALMVFGFYLDEHGNPLPGATSTLKTGTLVQREPLANGGGFDLALRPGQRYELELASASSPATQLAIEAGQPGEERDLGTILAQKGRWVSGRLVRAEDGVPVAGARISAPRSGSLQPFTDRLHGELLTSTSDAEGVFRLAGLGLYSTTVRIEAPGRARREVAIPADAKGSDLGEIELAGGVEVQLFAADVDRAGATARLDLGNRWAETEMLTAPVVEGWAAFRHVPAGRATASVVRDHELICDREIEVPSSGTLEVDCEATSSRVAGLVTVGGAPPGGGTLLWLPATHELPGLVVRHRTPLGAERSEAFGAGRPQVNVAVHPGGTFFAERLRPGAWEVIFAAEEGWTTSALPVALPATLADGAEHRIELPFPGHGLAGRVVDAEGNAVGAARVRELRSGVVATTDETGRFQLLGLAPGEVFLRAYFEGQTSAALAVEITAEQAPQAVTLVLEERPEDRLNLRVLNREGQAAAGALVFVELPGRGLRILTAAHDGSASMTIDPPYPARLRIAALTGDDWILGPWTPWNQLLAEPALLAARPTGALRVRSDETTGRVTVISASGWNLTALARRAGIPVTVSPGQPLLLTGLPAGAYTLRANSPPRAFAVEADGWAQVELD